KPNGLSRRSAIRLKVRYSNSAGRNGQINIQMVRCRTEVILNRAGRGFRTGLRYVDDQAVRHHTAATDQLNRAVGDGVAIDLQFQQTPFVWQERGDPRVDQVFMVIVGLLKMVGSQQHPLVPNDATITTHILYRRETVGLRSIPPAISI